MKEHEKRNNYLNDYHLFIKNSGYKNSFLNKSVASTYRFIKKPIAYKESLQNILSHKKALHHAPVNTILDPKAQPVPVLAEDTNVLQKTGKILITFTKDVLLGTSLLVVGTIGLMAIVVTPRAMFDKHVDYAPQSNYVAPTAQVSTYYQSFLNKLYLHEDATKEVLALKNQGLLNEVNPSNGYTPLVHAIHLKNKHAIEALVQNGATINLPTKEARNTLMTQLVYYNPDISVNFDTYTDITSYLLANGLDWKQNDYQLLKSTAQEQAWRDFWINYFAKNSPQSLTIYKDILQNNISDKEILLHNTLKNMTK